MLVLYEYKCNIYYIKKFVVYEVRILKENNDENINQNEDEFVEENNSMEFDYTNEINDSEEDSDTEEEFVTSEEIKNINNSKEEKGLVKKKRVGNMKDKKLKIIIIIVAILVVLVAVIAGFAIINKFNTNVYNNVYLNGTDMTGMSLEDVKKHVIGVYEQTLTDVKIDVYQADKLLDIIEPVDIDLTIDVDETVNQIFDVGRTGNIIIDNFDIMTLIFGKKDFEYIYNYNIDKLKISEESINSALDNKVVNDEYDLDEKEHKLIVIRGHKGNEIDIETYSRDIMKLLKEGKSVRYDVVTKEMQPKELDINKVYDEVHRDAIDAHVIEESGKKPVFKAEVYGYDFNVEDLKATLAKEENKVEDKKIDYKLIVTEPKVKYRDIAWSAYEDKLGGLTTYFPANNYNRAKNLKIALGYLNGVVIMPGETFSYNKTVGDVTAAKGYLPAATFKAGTVVDEVGGGICQTVSTLYNAVLYANLEVVTRYQHGLAVGYVPPSLDATMYYPNLDFKFKNNRNYPIKIVATYSNNGSLNISLYGTKEETEYEIVLTSKYISTLPYTTKYVDDPSMPAGTQKVKLGGVNGYTSESYRTVKLNGKVIKTELITRDTYKPTTKIVNRGTGGSIPTGTTPETPSKQPSSAPSTQPSSNPSASASSGAGSSTT